MPKAGRRLLMGPRSQSPTLPVEKIRLLLVEALKSRGPMCIYEGFASG